MNNIIINIPHSATKFPNEFKKRLLVNNKKFKEEMRLLTDSYTDEIFYNKDCDNLICEYSRLYCDVERFKDDSIEIMAKRGMGVVYEKTTDRKDLIRIDKEYKEGIISSYYDAYHNRLNELADIILKEYDQCIIIDGHSFSEKWAKIVNESKKPYPDICIGYDTEFSNKHLIDELKKCVEKYGFSYEENYPFSGAIVPSTYYLKKDKRITSIMIEINKKIYMDENTSEKKDMFSDIKNMVQEYIRKIC